MMVRCPLLPLTDIPIKAPMSAFGCKADMGFAVLKVRFWPKADISPRNRVEKF